ncbi:MAG: hypothetical protein KDE62_05535 [Calditrichaeota bacterium]|nr:hypothetical protein [Calditrichota bacterium]
MLFRIDHVLDAEEKASRRAISRTMTRAKTASSREVRKVYNIKASDFNAGVKVENYGRLGIFSVFGRRTPVMKFGARQRRTWPGARVKIKKQGGIRTIKHSFIAKMASDHIGVFRRNRRRMLKKPNREAIEEIYTISPVQMFRAHGLSMFEKTVKDHFGADYESAFEFFISRKLRNF